MKREGPLEVETEKVAKYFAWSTAMWILGLGVWFLGLGVVLAFLYWLIFCPWLPRRQAQTLKYRLDGTTLRLDRGAWFFSRHAVPLDRVTDITLFQGPLMRRCGIWCLQVQTAGAGDRPAEYTLYGVADAERVRDHLMCVRDEAAARGGRTS